MWAPLNFPLTNPQVVKTTVRLKGMNLMKGAKNFVKDTTRFLRKEPPVGSRRNSRLGKT